MVQVGSNISLKQLNLSGLSLLCTKMKQLVHSSSPSPACVSAGGDRAQALDSLHSIQRNVGWGLGAANQDQMSKLAGTPALMRLYQLLLFTMPGTPVFTYGDEIGLQAQVDNEVDE